MAKDEYLEIQDLDATPEADKVTMALIYISALVWFAALIVFQMKLGEYGQGMFE